MSCIIQAFSLLTFALPVLNSRYKVSKFSFEILNLASCLVMGTNLLSDRSPKVWVGPHLIPALLPLTSISLTGQHHHGNNCSNWFLKKLSGFRTTPCSVLARDFDPLSFIFFIAASLYCTAASTCERWLRSSESCSSNQVGSIFLCRHDTISSTFP